MLKKIYDYTDDEELCTFLFAIAPWQEISKSSIKWKSAISDGNNDYTFTNWLKKCFLIVLKKPEAPKQVFSCDYCEIFKNSFFNRATLVTASLAKQNKMVSKRKPLQIIFFGSRTIAPEENCPPNPTTNPKPNPNSNRGTIFLGGNCLVAPQP